MILVRQLGGVSMGSVPCRGPVHALGRNCVRDATPGTPFRNFYAVAVDDPAALSISTRRSATLPRGAAATPCRPPPPGALLRRGAATAKSKGRRRMAPPFFPAAAAIDHRRAATRRGSRGDHPAAASLHRHALRQVARHVHVRPGQDGAGSRPAIRGRRGAPGS
jgi:hypothetical protein